MLCGWMVGQKGWTKGGRAKDGRGGGRGGGGKKRVNGLRGQRSGSLASKGVYCSTGWVLVDELLSWVFVLRDHIFGSCQKSGSIK